MTKWIDDERHALTLLVATDGTDVQALVPPPPWAGAVHTCDLTAPRTCRCGRVHVVDDGADVLVFVGEPLGRVALFGAHPKALRLAIVPASAAHVALPGATTVVRDASRRAGLAASIIRHLLEGLYGDGVIGYDAADAKLVLGGARRFDFIEATGPSALEAARSAMARRPLASLGDCHLGLALPRDGTLCDLSLAMDVVWEQVSPDARAIGYGVIDASATEARVSLLFAAPPAPGPSGAAG